ncbi:hypothetical protein Ac2012v2_005545 [Leucoagaricus gongylophorus]
MPLDGHSYLISQGWSGLGTGLRQDSIIRPLAIPQKRTLSGLGKDRDEAFPFWDHLFSVAAKTIQVKLPKDDDDSSSDEPNSLPSPNTQLLDRTSTGILSNKAPKHGTLASASASASGSATPTMTPLSSLNLLTKAKREAAKRTLYSRFFRGPVLGLDSDLKVPDTDLNLVAGLPSTTKKNKTKDASEWDTVCITSTVSKNSGRTPMGIAKIRFVDAKGAAILESKKSKVQDGKRKWDDVDEGCDVIEESRERKRGERKMRKEQQEAEKKEKKAKKRAEKQKKRAEEKQARPKEVGELEQKKLKKRKCSDGTSSKPTSAIDSSTTDETNDGYLRPEEKKRGQKEKIRDQKQCKHRICECKRTKRAAIASKPDAGVDMSKHPNLDPATSELDEPKPKKKKKRKSEVQ